MFDSNSPKMQVLFHTNSDKKFILFDGISLEVSVLFDMNSEKKFLVLFCIDSLKVLELFQMNSKIIQLLFYKFSILVNLHKTEVLHGY